MPSKKAFGADNQQERLVSFLTRILRGHTPDRNIYKCLRKIWSELYGDIENPNIQCIER